MFYRINTDNTNWMHILNYERKFNFEKNKLIYSGYNNTIKLDGLVNTYTKKAIFYYDNYTQAAVKRGNITQNGIIEEEAFNYNNLNTEGEKIQFIYDYIQNDNGMTPLNEFYQQIL